MLKKTLAILLAVALAATMTVIAFADDHAIVTLDPNGATGEPKEIVADENKTVVLPSSAEECGFEFPNFELKEFNTAEDGSGTAYAPGATINDVEEPMTLFAYWVKEGSELVEWHVYYNANGGTGEMIDDEKYPDAGYAYTLFCDFENGDREFVCWNTKADGTGTSYEEDEAFEIFSDVTLYAIWSDEEEEEYEEEYEEEVTPTDEDEENPETGDATATVAAMATAIVALGGVMILRKKH